ncbi:transposase [Bradyrhizobium elkanii USDA 61]|nr:transposase [Bradyrhizobium elkanii USDA 61]
MQVAQANKARDRATQLSQAAESGVAELRQSLRKEHDRAEALAGELAKARRDLKAQLALSSKASDEASQAKKAAETATAELRQSLKTEHDRAETLTGELARVRGELETQLAVSSKAGGGTVQVKKGAKGATAELRQSLKKERDTAEVPAPGHKPTLMQAAEAAATEQPTVAEAQGDPEVARLLARASALLVQGDIGAARIVLEHAGPPVQAMIAFIDDHREAYGVEPICKVLPIAPSTYHDHVAKRRNPARLSARARRDAALKVEVRRVFEENFSVYGVRKVWRQLRREGRDVARCTVARLMKEMGLQGAIRGKPVRTTISDRAAPCPLDHVNRQFQAPRPNALWVSDFTYVATWIGFVYVAFVVDAYARRIVGWRVSRSAHAGFVLDALEQALAERRPLRGGGLVHHSDRGVQYVSIKYTERLAEAGIEPSVGSVGDSYDNALAETINGLYKAEVIHRRGPWRSFDAVEYATLEWVDWFNNRRLLEPIGNIPPAEAEARYYAQTEEFGIAA